MHSWRSYIYAPIADFFPTHCLWHLSRPVRQKRDARWDEIWIKHPRKDGDNGAPFAAGLSAVRNDALQTVQTLYESLNMHDEIFTTPNRGAQWRIFNFVTAYERCSHQSLRRFQKLLVKILWFQSRMMEIRDLSLVGKVLDLHLHLSLDQPREVRNETQL